MDLCRDACYIFSRDSVVMQDHVGGLSKADTIGKNADEVSKKHNALLDRYNENGDLAGMYYDMTFAIFMLKDRDDVDSRYVVYADINDKGAVADLTLLNTYLYYEPSDEQYDIIEYWSHNHRSTSKWERLDRKN